MSKPHDSYDPKDDRILVVSGGGVIRSFTAMGLRKLMATSDVRPLGKKHPWYKENVPVMFLAGKPLENKDPDLRARKMTQDTLTQ